MHKKDLIETVARKTGKSQKEVKDTLEAILSTINEALKKKDKVTLVGFGTFSVQHVPQRTGRNDAEAGVVNDATDVVSESWILNGVDYNKETKLWEGTVATRDTKGKLIDTGIKVSSSNVVNKDGTNAASGVWTSQSYRKEAAEAEKK